MQTTGGVSIIRTLYIDNQTRNPKVKGINEFVNNVVSLSLRMSVLMVVDVEFCRFTTGVEVEVTSLEILTARHKPISSTTFSSGEIMRLVLAPFYRD